MKDYFSASEKECHCGCGLNRIDEPGNQDFLSVCNKARELFGEPIKASCMTRCEKHNLAVGGAPGSAHMDGRALDTPCTDANKRVRLVRAFFDAGFERVEVSGVHVHADMKKGARPVLLIKTERGIT